MTNKPQRALVTGGAGFIGSHLVRALLKREWEVSILDNFYTGRMGNLGEEGKRRSYVVQASVTNYDALRRAMAGVSVVFHLAARLDWNERPKHPAVLFMTNVQGTAWVLTVARSMGVHRVVFASSAAVYGDITPCYEDNPCVPNSVYGDSKLAAEKACLGFDRMGLETTILRIFNVWGPGGRGVVNQFVEGKSSSVNGTGEQTRDFVHVDDVVRALIGAAYWDPGIYNVGTGVETSILGLWHLIRGDEEPDFKPMGPQETMYSFANIERVSGLWQPKIDLPGLEGS